MCYLLALFCFAAAFLFAIKGMTICIAFLIASVCFGLFESMFCIFNQNSKNKWEALQKTYMNMSTNQLKEVIEK